jgi:hypothetical protein
MGLDSGCFIIIGIAGVCILYFVGSGVVGVVDSSPLSNSLNSILFCLNCLSTTFVFLFFSVSPLPYSLFFFKNSVQAYQQGPPLPRHRPKAGSELSHSTLPQSAETQDRGWLVGLMLG